MAISQERPVGEPLIEPHALGQMLDQMAIQDVLSSYSAAVTRRDWAAIAEVFAVDATWDVFGGPQEFHFSGKEIGPGIKGAVELSTNLVQINTPAVIVIDGDRATARSVIHEYGNVADNGTHVESSGTYDDVLKKVNGKWKFESRSFTMRQFWAVPIAARYGCI